jgi:hypothetical protein
MERKGHWEHVFTTKGEQDVSWFESLPALSLEMLEASGLTHESCVLDVGGGDSRLVDHLSARGMECLAVLDVSGAALRRAQARLGDAANVPVWIEADVTGEWSLKPMDIWHDAESLTELLGAGFSLVESRRHVHQTPWGNTQAFQYSRFSRAA